MLKPDFKSYSLALIKDNKTIYSSEWQGIRPLVECIRKYPKLKGCVLHDKVVGLAAARLIVYSAMIDSVFTNVISMKAKKLLEDNHIKLEAEKVVDKIMNRQNTGQCPFEKKAEAASDNKAFFEDVIKAFYTD